MNDNIVHEKINSDILCKLYEIMQMIELPVVRSNIPILTINLHESFFEEEIQNNDITAHDNLIDIKYRLVTDNIEKKKLLITKLLTNAIKYYIKNINMLEINHTTDNNTENILIDIVDIIEELHKINNNDNSIIENRKNLYNTLILGTYEQIYIPENI